MWLSRKRLILAVTIPLAVLGLLDVLVMYPDYIAGKRYIHDMRRDARGPWPRDRVGQAVIVRCPPGSGNWPAIEGELRNLLGRTNVGYFDGRECSNSRCSLFFYGPDARKLLDTVTPVLKESQVTRQASVFTRLGRGDANTGVMQEIRW